MSQTNETPKAKLAAQALAKMGGFQPQLKDIPRRYWDFELDAEEQALMNSIEAGEWESVPNLQQEIERYQHYAAAQVQSLQSINTEQTGQAMM
ncbi:hypothetical protein [Synechococcus sp. PCC 6312]|uniref:hypothetical protein n=1 Tax=Synechococcus sp. (strain ATCC 27167 / PCC 6312) TaxID=195253 RepID=UPI00029F2B98|nr:hypothetical protein [Synechococcus sp. PCC 6312]AFY59550.1 hypothetical protein Syn6312_0314 [Synechococcus sp. PCC 6312]